MARSQRQTNKEIRDIQQRVSREIRGRKTGMSEGGELFAGSQSRWVRTTTSAANPTYPPTPATKFVVEFGDLAFDNKTVGNETAVFTAYTPKTTRIAYSHFGWIPSGTVCRASYHHARWYIQSDYMKTILKAKTTSQINNNSSGTVNIWLNNAVSSPLWTVTAWLFWMNGTTAIPTGKEVLIQWFQDEANGAGKWTIIAREC